METIKRIAGRLLQEEDGQNLIEYALVAGIIGLGAIAAMTTLRTSISNEFTTVQKHLQSAI